ncbi:MAG: sugar transferase [Opitutaceae bacterium]|jgi:lipopolysaccharide/colanic/teichoic acid biosynthesis glycosyltransferase
MQSKRLFDLLLVLIAAPVWLPPMAVVALMVRWKLGEPVLFRQKRPGRGGVVFELIKFRSMRNAVAADGKALPDAERLTAFGRALRASSLDELPELINVLRGEMSLVGPRPLLIEYLPRYDARQARRHEVLPGLTGLAQVRGRNALTWEEKFEWDVRYVEQRTLWLDIRILIQTVGAVCKRDGISAKGEATMPEFRGKQG